MIRNFKPYELAVSYLNHVKSNRSVRGLDIDVTEFDKLKAKLFPKPKSLAIFQTH